MSKITTPYRYDFVGSFLRPQRLKEAKISFQNNEITQEAYDEIVNEEITSCSKTERTWISCNHRWRIQKNFLAS